MNNDFPRVLSLLRKERGLSQKDAAASLGISQALLSHYEKGIREPGLEFLCRVASFYEVSTDYLLGRSAEKNGARITVEDLPEDNPLARDRTSGGIMTALNKKLLINSLQVLYDLLGKCGCKGLTGEISSFLMLNVYRAFRLLYYSNRNNQPGFFSVSPLTADGTAEAAASLALTRANALAAGCDVNGEKGMDFEKAPEISADALSAQYPLFAGSLLNLVKNAEGQLKQFTK